MQDQRRLKILYNCWPALLIKMWISGWQVFNSCTAVRMEVSEPKSNLSVVTSFPVSFIISFAASSAFPISRHAKTNSAPTHWQAFHYLKTKIVIWLQFILPRRLSSRAVSFPIPVLLPVITTTFPSRRTLFLQRGPWNKGIIFQMIVYLYCNLTPGEEL